MKLKDLRDRCMLSVLSFLVQSLYSQSPFSYILMFNYIFANAQFFFESTRDSICAKPTD